ncbi:MAG TPA: hypothetical protein VIJ15_09070, partial [Dermatophilaceae bacterium]
LDCWSILKGQSSSRSSMLNRSTTLSYYEQLRLTTSDSRPLIRLRPISSWPEDREVVLGEINPHLGYVHYSPL